MGRLKRSTPGGMIYQEQSLLSSWPIRRSAGWLDYVNEPQTESELIAIRRAVNRGAPFGDETWSTKAVSHMGSKSRFTLEVGQGRNHKTVPDTFLFLRTTRDFGDRQLLMADQIQRFTLKLGRVLSTFFRHTLDSSGLSIPAFPRAHISWASPVLLSLALRDNLSRYLVRVMILLNRP